MGVSCAQIRWKSAGDKEKNGYGCGYELAIHHNLFRISSVVQHVLQ